MQSKTKIYKTNFTSSKKPQNGMSYWSFSFGKVGLYGLDLGAFSTTLGLEGGVSTGSSERTLLLESSLKTLSTSCSQLGTSVIKYLSPVAGWNDATAIYDTVLS